MDKLLVTLVFTYFVISCYFFSDCLKLFKRKATSPEDLFLSLVVSIIVTFFWPVVIPMSSPQLENKNLELGTARPLILAIFIVSLLTVSGLVAFAGAML